MNLLQRGKGERGRERGKEREGETKSKRDGETGQALDNSAQTFSK